MFRVTSNWMPLRFQCWHPTTKRQSEDDSIIELHNNGISHSHIGLGVSTEEFRFIITIMLLWWSQPRVKSPSMQWLIQCVWMWQTCGLNVCMYTLWVLQWSMNHFAYLAMQVHAQCTRDNMTAYIFTTAITTYVLENQIIIIWFVARCCIKAGIILKNESVVHHCRNCM